jgi:hypothetical protein
VLKGGENDLKLGKIKSIIAEVALSKKNTQNTQLFSLTEYLENLSFFFVGLYDTDIKNFKEGMTYSNALFVYVG